MVFQPRIRGGWHCKLFIASLKASNMNPTNLCLKAACPTDPGTPSLAPPAPRALAGNFSTLVHPHRLFMKHFQHDYLGDLNMQRGGVDYVKNILWPPIEGTRKGCAEKQYIECRSIV